MTERGENEAEACLDRAQEMRRHKDYEGAIKLYQLLHREHPKSRHAPPALWKAAGVYYRQYYNLEQATQLLRKLIAEYPNSPLVKDALLRLAEIHEAEDRDLDLAEEYWKRARGRNLSPKERRQSAFRLGDIHLQQGRIEEAKRYLQEVTAAKANDRLGQQGLMRLGTIAQMESEHQTAIHFFEEAMASDECQECLVQAQRRLAESYEFMGNHTQASVIAERNFREHPPGARSLVDQVELERDQ